MWSFDSCSAVTTQSLLYLVVAVDAGVELDDGSVTFGDEADKVFNSLSVKFGSRLTIVGGRGGTSTFGGDGDVQPWARRQNPRKLRFKSLFGVGIFGILFILLRLHLVVFLSDQDDVWRPGKVAAMLGRFERRFRAVEDGVKATGKKMEEMSLPELDRFWDEAKKRERS